MTQVIAPIQPSDVSERLGLEPASELWGEHRSRYRFAATYAMGRRALDAACGTGFGCEMLAQAGARLVVGADTSAEGLETARHAFDAPGRLFVRADLEQMPFPDEAFDLITSMETIEHVARPGLVVHEFARCLAPSGTLVLSTPNRLYRPTPDGRPSNPFHLREYSPDELSALLVPWFDVRVLGQFVDRSYPAVPFLLRPEQQGFRSREAASLIPWKLANRLPFSVKDRLARAVFGRGFYPGETDYHFSAERVEAAHDLVAVATRRE